MSDASTAQPGFAAKYTSKACLTGLAVVIIGAALAAASGPLYQAGVLELFPAFGVLRYSVIGMMVGAGICVIGVILGVIAFKGGVVSKGAAGLIGIVIAVSVFMIPYSQTSRNAPPIHEVTTDFDNPPAFVDVVPLRTEWGARNPPEYVPLVEGFGRSVDVVAEQKDHYPDIQPLRFEGMNYEAVFELARQGVEDMGWTLVSADPILGRIEAYDTTQWFGFVDDVVIRIEEQPMAYELDIRSKSRIGFGDVGANAERVRKYLKAVSGAASQG
jgi:uncharacterized protein (DUF1499 family)